MYYILLLFGLFLNVNSRQIYTRLNSNISLCNNVIKITNVSLNDEGTYKCNDDIYNLRIIDNSGIFECNVLSIYTANGINIPPIKQKIKSNSIVHLEAVAYKYRGLHKIKWVMNNETIIEPIFTKFIRDNITKYEIYTSTVAVVPNNTVVISSQLIGLDNKTWKERDVLLSVSALEKIQPDYFSNIVLALSLFTLVNAIIMVIMCYSNSKPNATLEEV